MLREAKKAGVKRRIDGVKMLVFQGAASFKIWTGISPPLDVMESAVRKALQSANSEANSEAKSEAKSRESALER